MFILKTLINKASICWEENHPYFWLYAHYFLTLFCHECIIIQYKADFFFHQNVTTVEFYFYVIIACCLLLAAAWARKGLVTEILSENSFEQALFHCGPVLGRNSGRVTRVLRQSTSAKLQLPTTTSNTITAYSKSDIHLLFCIWYIKLR